MRALLFLTKQSFKNNLKKAIKKPMTYIVLAVVVIYIGVIVSALINVVRSGVDFPVQIVVYILTIWIFLSVCSNFLVYAKLKGIIFQKGHAHFIFPAPINPKVVLLHGAVKNFIINVIINMLAVIVGITVFHISLLQALLLFLVLGVCETVLEGSLIVFLYAKQDKYKRLVRGISFAIYGVIGMILGIVVWHFYKNGFSLRSLDAVINLPALQMIPVAGWGVCAIRLIFLGASPLHIAGTVLYLVTCVGLLVVACCVKSTGEYYEDGAKFADDYAKLRTRAQDGEMVFSVGSIGKKKSFRKSRGSVKGKGAQAIFYRQLLEYKKEKYFIFGTTTVMVLVVSIVCIFFINFPDKFTPGLALLGVMAYVVFLSTGYLGKWGKELENPYVFLIPDSSIRKLWYATAMEHVKAFMDGSILSISIGIAWKVPAWEVIAVIFIYTVLQANRLYIKILIESLLGGTFGKTGKGILTMLMQGSVLALGIALAALLGLLIDYQLVFPIILFYSMIVTVLIACLTVTKFETMEQWD